MRAIKDKIIVKAEEPPTRSNSGLYLAGGADENQVISGIIFDYGPGADNTTIRVGDRVWFNKFTAAKVKAYYVLTVEQVLAVGEESER